MLILARWVFFLGRWVLFRFLFAIASHSKLILLLEICYVFCRRRRIKITLIVLLWRYFSCISLADVLLVTAFATRAIRAVYAML